MTLDALIMLSGVLVTLLPFLGFPLKWDNMILVVIGIVVIMLGIIVRRRGLKRPSAIHTAIRTESGSTFVESAPSSMSEAHAE